MLKKIIIFYFKVHLILFISLFTNAQPNLEWEKNFGGSNLDEAYSIIQTLDNGYIVVGTSESSNGDISENNGWNDIWIIKLNEIGDIEWEKSFGGTGYDYAYSVQQTLDSGFIITGNTFSFDGDFGENNGWADCFILKIDTIGNLEWSKFYGGTDPDYGNSIIQTTDGGFITAGVSQSNDIDVSDNNGGIDIWILKLDNLGNLEWEKNFGGLSSDHAHSIKQTNDEGFIIAGHSSSNNIDVSGGNGNIDYWIVKLDNLGNLEWEKSYGGSRNDSAYEIQLTSDGGFIVAGISSSEDGDVSENNSSFYIDCWILKLDSLGSLEWEKNYGGSGNDYANSIQQTSDEGFIIAGSTESNDIDVSNNNGALDYWLFKLDQDGNLEWEKNYGGLGNDYANSISITNDGGCIIAGSSGSSDGDLNNNNGDLDFWIIKLSPLNLGVTNLSYSTTFNLFPNPSDGNFKIHSNVSNAPINIKIFSISGNKIYENIVADNLININNIPSGLYFLYIEQNKYTSQIKIIIK